MSRVQVEITGDDRSAARAFTKLEAKVQGLEAKLKLAGRAGERVGQKMDKTGKSIRSAFNPKALVGFLGVVGTGGTILAGLRLITAELRQQIELQERAKLAQITLSASRRNLLLNLVATSDADRLAVISSAGKISRQTGAPERFVTQALASAVSASGGNIKASTAAVTRAARLFAHEPETIGTFAGSLLDMSRVTGTPDAGVNAGLLAFAAGRSRVVDPRAQAQNIPGALIGITSQDATAAGAVALFAALSGGAADIQGRISGTGGIAFAEQLQKFLPGLPRQPPIPGIGPELAGPDIGQLAERIKFLQANQPAAREFLAGASFEKKVGGPLKELLTNPFSIIAQEFASNLRDIPGPEGLRRIAQDTLQSFNLDPLERGARAERAFKNISAQSLLGDLVGAEGDISRKGLIDVLKVTGLGAAASGFVRARFELRSRLGRRDAFGVAEGILTDRLSQLENPTITKSGRSFAGTFPREQTEDEGRNAELIRILITELAALRGATADLKDAAGRMRGGPTLVGPLIDEGS